MAEHHDDHNSYEHLQLRHHDDGLTVVTLNRPDLHNAFNDEMIAELTDVFAGMGGDDKVRVIVLSAAGKSFCAGADLNVMRAMKEAGLDENKAQAERLATMFDTINTCPKPVIGRVHGAALGGGIGLVAVCDYVIATANAQFGLTEARLGIVPGVISPYVIAKIGESYARAYFLSGMRFNAGQARYIHLVHEVVGDEAELDNRVSAIVDEYLQAGPQAAARAKQLIAELPKQHDLAARKAFTSQMIAEARASDEGQEGMDAFLAKRKPKWAS